VLTAYKFTEEGVTSENGDFVVEYWSAPESDS